MNRLGDLKLIYLMCKRNLYCNKVSSNIHCIWVKFAQSYLYMAYQLSTFVKYPITIYPAWIREF